MPRENIEKSVTVFISFLISGFIFSSCAKKEPEWVKKGSGAFPQEQKIYGVGVANQTPSEAMDRTRCDTRARAELAKILNTYVASLVTDFMENNRDFFNPDKEGLDEFTQSIIKTVTEATLVGSQIIDRYIDEKRKIHYCLAALEINNALMNLADKMREAARQQHRALVKEKSDEMLKKLDEELKKKTERGF